MIYGTLIIGSWVLLGLICLIYSIVPYDYGEENERAFNTQRPDFLDNDD